MLNPQVSVSGIKEFERICIWKENTENSQMKMLLLKWLSPLQQTNEKENYVLEREQVIFADDGS